MGQCYCCRCNSPTVAGPPQTSLTNNQTAIPTLHTKDHFASHMAGVATEKETHSSGKGGSARQLEARDGFSCQRKCPHTRKKWYPITVDAEQKCRVRSQRVSSSYISQSDAHLESTRSGDPFESVCVESMPATLPAGGSAS